MKNPISEYKFLKKNAAYYEHWIKKMARYRKYAESGRLLMSNVNKGDRIYLIGSQTDLFDQVHVGVVKRVEFIGNNDAEITVMDVTNTLWRSWGRKYVVLNSMYGILFFTDCEAAERALAEEGVSSVKKNKVLYCCRGKGPSHYA